MSKALTRTDFNFPGQKNVYHGKVVYAFPHCAGKGVIFCRKSHHVELTVVVAGIRADKLRDVLPKGLDKQKTEDFIIKACEHYRKYLIRQRERER